MLGWVVVWYHAPHHIGGGIVCLVVALCARARLLVAMCPLISYKKLMVLCAGAHARGIVCARARSWHLVHARQWQHRVVVAWIARHVACKQSMWNNKITVCLVWYHTIISCVHTEIKQNSDVFLDLFWLTFRLPKTLVFILHTTKVPEATRKKSAPNK